MAQQTITIPALNPEELAQYRKPISTRRRIIVGFLKNYSGMLGLVVVFIMVFSAIFADQIACAQTCIVPHSPTRQNIVNKLKPPFWSEGASPTHYLGTDQLGRDVLSRLIYGSRSSLSVAFAAAMISVVLGVVFGLVAGYFGGWSDGLISRVSDAQQAFPFLVLAIAIRALLGPTIIRIGDWPIDIGLILLIGYWGWVRYAKVTRGNVLSARQKEYVEAAHVIGTPTHRILFRHLLPNVVSPVIVLLTLSIAGLIVVESSLSFLGLGIQPPTPSWGSMLSEGRSYLDNGWWISTFAGLAIAATVLGVNLMGDGLRDILDPRLRT